MKAITFTSRGPPPIFEQIEIEEPIPRNDEVLLKVHAIMFEESRSTSQLLLNEHHNNRKYISFTCARYILCEQA